MNNALTFLKSILITVLIAWNTSIIYALFMSFMINHSLALLTKVGMFVVMVSLLANSYTLLMANDVHPHLKKGFLLVNAAFIMLSTYGMAYGGTDLNERLGCIAVLCTYVVNSLLLIPPRANGSEALEPIGIKAIR